jgi:hypothetical protein
VRRLAPLLLLSLSCAGPAADDADVCQDLVSRLCAQPVCESVTQTLVPGESCSEELLRRTGCGSVDFQFSTPSRARFLECRAPLLRLSDRTDVHPACEDVTEALSACPDLVAFLRGRAP